MNDTFRTPKIRIVKGWGLFCSSYMKVIDRKILIFINPEVFLYRVAAFERISNNRGAVTCKLYSRSAFFRPAIPISLRMLAF
jgi:hypothetical protein